MQNNNVIYGGTFSFCPLLQQVLKCPFKAAYRSCCIWLVKFILHDHPTDIVTCVVSTPGWVAFFMTYSLPADDVPAQVLLPTGTLEEIQILLESGVRIFCPRLHYAHCILPHRPSVTFFCDLDYDPFLIMQDQNKVYGKHTWNVAKCIPDVPWLGFTVSLYEYENTIPTLWNAVKGLSP